METGTRFRFQPLRPAGDQENVLSVKVSVACGQHRGCAARAAANRKISGCLTSPRRSSAAERAGPVDERVVQVD